MKRQKKVSLKDRFWFRFLGYTPVIVHNPVAPPIKARKSTRTKIKEVRFNLSRIKEFDYRLFLWELSSVSNKDGLKGRAFGNWVERQYEERCYLLHHLFGYMLLIVALQFLPNRDSPFTWILMLTGTILGAFLFCHALDKKF